MVKLNIPVILAVSLACSGVVAEEKKSDLTSMFSVAGNCMMLVFANEQRPCKDVIINTEYDSGRTGFYFLDESEGGAIISFSGMGQEQQSPAESLRLQPLDAIVFDGGREPAVGFCTFENPFVGAARIECSAFLENGELFSGFFMSDGSSPKMMAPDDYDG